MVIVVLICLALVWILFATIQDLRSREVANWLNFSLIIFALGLRFFYGLFSNFNFKNGFNKGDIMIMYGKKPGNIKLGEVIVFRSGRPDPIIHRVIRKWELGGKYYFQTKGDNNKDSIKTQQLDETNIAENEVVGKAVLRVPLLGYIKIGFVEMLKLAGA